LWRVLDLFERDAEERADSYATAAGHFSTRRNSPEEPTR
jgi:hypothetical protein